MNIPFPIERLGSEELSKAKHQAAIRSIWELPDKADSMLIVAALRRWSALEIARAAATRPTLAWDATEPESATKIRHRMAGFTILCQAFINETEAWNPETTSMMMLSGACILLATCPFRDLSLCCESVNETIGHALEDEIYGD